MFDFHKSLTTLKPLIYFNVLTDTIDLNNKSTIISKAQQLTICSKKLIIPTDMCKCRNNHKYRKQNTISFSEGNKPQKFSLLKGNFLILCQCSKNKYASLRKGIQTKDYFLLYYTFAFKGIL